MLFPPIRLDKRRNRIALKTSLSSLIIFVSPAKAQAAGSCPEGIPEPIAELVDLLKLIQELGVSLALLIAVIMLIYAGILMMRGDPDSVQKARSIIWRVVLGLTIVLLAGGMVEVVKQTLCGVS